MKDLPIIFNDEMVRAILSGTKTMTRRPMKDRCLELFEVAASVGECHSLQFCDIADERSQPYYREFCPFGAVGDRIIPAMYIPSLDKRYCADVFGNIWSRANSCGEWRRLSGSANSKGYLTVTPASNGKYKTRLVHDLVSEAFLGERPNGMQIRHLDGFQRNNAPENLDYGTQEQNWSDRLVNGISLGEEHHNSKLTIEIVNDIRESRLSQRALSVKYGVSQSTIWSVRNAKTWNENPVASPPNMPRWASRITLEITDVRVERLQDITEDDARTEGVTLSNPKILSHRDEFRQLWGDIYGCDGWRSNPWVWVIGFRRVDAGYAAGASEESNS